MSDTPAGWYPDPQMAGTQRYWDGANWSAHVAPQQMTAAGSSGGSNLESVGFVFAIVIPIVGMVMGLIVLTRDAGRGIAMIVVSLFFTAVWAFFLTSFW